MSALPPKATLNAFISSVRYGRSTWLKGRKADECGAGSTLLAT